jgi:hypothetical protein
MRQLARRMVFAGMLVALAGAVVWSSLRPRHGRSHRRDARVATVEDRVAQHGPRVDARLRPLFEASGLVYPPGELAFVAFKDTRLLELYARDTSQHAWAHVHTYTVQGASGNLGPKLQEGDRQVPEGIYAVEYLNAGSRFHLSLKLDYPNAFDRRMGVADGRSDLGSDIMIHGGSASIGCLAMGDDGVEDLFVLAAHVGIEQVRVVICPTDFRQGRQASVTGLPSWTPVLHERLRAALAQFERNT